MQSQPVITYLLLGTNLGDRHGYLLRARQELASLVGEIESVSSVYETEPWGTEGQPAYLNQAVAVSTNLKPEPLLKTILEIEKSLGRVREGHWTDRTIDIDILYYDSLIVSGSFLEIPHPRLHLRNFVLYPLNEIAPEFIHPVFNLTNSRLLQNSTDNLSVSKL